MKKSTQENNFWIIYADLMAGLLFVFILLVSAIVTKYVITQKNLASKSNALNKSEQLIISKDELLRKLQTELTQLNLNLSSEQEDNEKLANTLAQIAGEKELILESVNEKDLQIAALAAALNQHEIAIKDKEQKISELKSDLGKIKADFSKLKDYKSSLINQLAARLDNDLLIDLNSGSIKLASNVLFDSASFELKPQSADYLKKTLKKYFSALESSNIIDSIDAIIIEGHTDSNGGYLYNLELSQKRSLEILKFIYELKPSKKILSRLSAVGRGYLEPITLADGSEDKAASRRIEIKLVFNNQQALSNYEKSINDTDINRL